MGTYAQSTTVTVDKSQAEIERTLQRYGAAGFMRGWSNDKAFLEFIIENRRIRFVVPMPAKDQFRYIENGKRRISESAVQSAYEQACRQKWRALALVIKAKLEAIDSEISTVEDEFLAFVVLPSGQTVGQVIKPQIEKSYLEGSMPLLLASGE